MSEFSPPIVHGPLSTENKYVILSTQETGTTLKVIANGKTVIGTKNVADGGWDVVQIDPAFLPLKAGTALTATQEKPGGPPSNPSPKPVVVWAVPKPLGQGKFDGVIYGCVTHVRVFGLTPGAKFEIHQPLGSVIGTGETYGGSAEVGLKNTVKQMDPLILRQKAGGQKSDAQYPMPIVSVPQLPSRKLRQLKITRALDCDYSVVLEGTINGVGCTITRDRLGTATDFVGFGLDNVTTFWVNEPFHGEDVVSAVQWMDKQCDMIESDPSPQYLVKPQQVQPPLIIPPICLDAQRLDLINIRPGAAYKVYEVFKTTSGDKQRLNCHGLFPKKDPQPFVYINPVKPPADQLPGTVPSLFINQKACEWTSPPSPQVAMEPLGAPVTPALPDPLYACAVCVRVTNVRPGSWVSVHSQLRGGSLAEPQKQWLGGEIGGVHAWDTEVSVPVAPLIKGDTVWACATGCQNIPSHSVPAQVAASVGVLQAEITEPVYPSDTAINIRKLVTGASVIARVSGPNHPGGEEYYSAYAWGPEISMYVGQLFDGDKITVFQSLCHTDATENQSNTVNVHLGAMAVSIAPSEASKGWNTKFLVTATDPKRNDMLVSGEVLFDGLKVGQTNIAFAWLSWNLGKVAVQVNADGYQPWLGSINVVSYFDPNAGIGGVGSSKSPDGRGAGGKKSSTPSYTYSCEPLQGGVKFKVNGTGFPPGAKVYIDHHFDGIFTDAWGQSLICGIDEPQNQKVPFGPVTVQADGKFEATITIMYGCQPTCRVRVVVTSPDLQPGQIVDPGGPFCQCRGY